MSDEKKPIISRDDPGSQPVTQPIVTGRRRRELTTSDFGRMNLGKTYWRSRAKDIQYAVARDAIIKFCFGIVDFVKDGKGMVFTGDEGVGKSWAASVVAKEAVRWGFTTRITSHEELQEIQFKDRPFDDSMSILDRIRSVDLLVIDGVNDDFIEDNRFGPRHMEKLIARRAGEMKSTLVTTRIKPAMWKEDKRLKSLWGVLQGSNVGVQIKGEDLRQKSIAGFHDQLYSKEEK